MLSLERGENSDMVYILVPSSKVKTKGKSNPVAKIAQNICPNPNPVS